METLSALAYSQAVVGGVGIGVSLVLAARHRTMFWLILSAGIVMTVVEVLSRNMVQPDGCRTVCLVAAGVTAWLFSRRLKRA